ncbi:unnamed protein product [Brassicogethes aeneus]|uniref:Uncharacterized protein n=1 Tax=Brassicogethes aeneus TaxID=1431903 RepID=A0A9P0FG56_BRAAE|nr:unnamed protein product [Brassicogethes aeneus]
MTLMGVPSKSIKDLPTEAVTESPNSRTKLKNSILQLRLPIEKKLIGKEASTNMEIKCISSMDGINPSLAPPLSSIRNIMIVDEHQLVNNQKLHWPNSAATSIMWSLTVIILGMLMSLC